MGTEDYLFTLLGAEFYALLYRAKDITALIKSADGQRTDDEQKFVREGGLRTLLVEFLLFVPVSSFLFFIILPFFKLAKFGDVLTGALAGDLALRVAFYVVAGMVSYNFPFVLVREMATRVALNTIRESLDLQEPKKVKPRSRQKEIEKESR